MHLASIPDIATGLDLPKSPKAVKSIVTGDDDDDDQAQRYDDKHINTVYYSQTDTIE
jgi:hypothetical protein